MFWVLKNSFLSPSLQSVSDQSTGLIHMILWWVIKTRQDGSRLNAVRMTRSSKINLPPISVWRGIQVSLSWLRIRTGNYWGKCRSSRKIKLSACFSKVLKGFSLSPFFPFLFYFIWTSDELTSFNHILPRLFPPQHRAHSPFSFLINNPL